MFDLTSNFIKLLITKTIQILASIYIEEKSVSTNTHSQISLS